MWPRDRSCPSNGWRADGRNLCRPALIGQAANIGPAQPGGPAACARAEATRPAGAPLPRLSAPPDAIPAAADDGSNPRNMTVRHGRWGPRLHDASGIHETWTRMRLTEMAGDRAPTGLGRVCGGAKTPVRLILWRVAADEAEIDDLHSSVHRGWGGSGGI